MGRDLSLCDLRFGQLRQGCEYGDEISGRSKWWKITSLTQQLFAY